MVGTSTRLPCVLPFLALFRRAVILVQMVLLNVVDDGHGDEVAHAHLPPEEKPDLSAADVVLDELLNHIDSVLPGLQARQRLVDIGAAAFHNERLVR